MGMRQFCIFKMYVGASQHGVFIVISSHAFGCLSASTRDVKSVCSKGSI
jgi:hypothetical protein